MDHGDEQEAQGVDQDVTLAPLHLLGGIVAARPAAFRGFHRLAVDHGGRGAGLTPLLFARLDGQGMVDAAPGAVLAPGREIGVHRAPGWELLGQQASLAAGREQVEERVDHLAQDRGARPADRLRRRQMWRDQGPLPIGQIACVALTLALVLLAGRFSPNLVPPVIVATTTESQVTETTQLFLGQTLRDLPFRSLVTMVESANLWNGDNLACFGALDRPGDRTVLTQGQVSARAVVACQNPVHRRNSGNLAIGRTASRPCERCSSCFPASRSPSTSA